MSENLTVNPNSAPCGCGRPMLLNATSYGCERWYCGWCCLYFISEVPRPGHTHPNWSTGSNFEVHVANMQPIRPLPAAVTTTCARCSSTIDPAAVEQHHERCFVVGDWVRLDMLGCHLTGKVQSVTPDVITVIPNAMHGEWYTGKVGKPFTIRINDNSLKNLRHIQRPGRAAAEPTMCCICGKRDTVSWECDHGKEQPTLSARLGHLKHGPGGSGLAGPCDADCRKCEVEREVTSPPTQTPTDPLDVEYDGWKLRDLLEAEEHSRHEGKTDKVGWAMAGGWRCATPGQRAAVSAHWSASLRARISAAKERERLTVCMPIDAEDLPWR